MGRSRNNGLARDLIALPWQISAVLAVGAFVAFRWLVPLLLPERGPLAGLKGDLATYAWIAFAGLGVITLLAALRGAFAGMKGKRTGPPRPASRSTAPVAPTAPGAWSVEALRLLEWKRVELLCARYYETAGFTTATVAAGPDGGIDVKLFKNDPTQALAIVQCKAWSTRPVGVKEIRELLGVMVHEGVRRGIFVTTGSYTPDALRFGAANPIQLLDGAAFAQKLCDLPMDKQGTLLDVAFEGDYRTPSCASCGIKLVARDSKRGPFWGCVHYPRCKTTLPMRDR